MSPEEEFTKAVLNIVKKELGVNSKYISKTRALKFVCIVANDIDYNEIPRGYYKHGIFSFKISNILNELHFGSNLQETTIIPTEIDEELEGKIIHVVRSRKDKFVLKKDDFLRWIHYDSPPLVYKPFYKYNSDFYLIRQQIINKKQELLIHPYEEISNIITNYNLCLKNVRDNYLEVYFDFTDLLEDILLVSKRRNIKPNTIGELLSNLNLLYEDLIYPCLTPFEESATGRGNENEKQIFRHVSNRRAINASRQILEIKHYLKTNNLTPSLHEYRDEILSSIP